MTSTDLAKRVRAAAGAAWWALIIAYLFMAGAWCGVLTLLDRKPAWAIVAWGGGEIQWGDVHRIYITFFGVLKVLLFILLVVAMWLSFWHRRLRRIGESEG
jgi:hypothetical protein